MYWQENGKRRPKAFFKTALSTFVSNVKNFIPIYFYYYYHLLVVSLLLSLLRSMILYYHTFYFNSQLNIDSSFPSEQPAFQLRVRNVIKIRFKPQNSCLLIYKNKTRIYNSLVDWNKYLNPKATPCVHTFVPVLNGA